MTDELPKPNKHTSFLTDASSAPPMADRQMPEDLIPWVIEFRVVGTPNILRATMGRTFIMGRSDADHKFFPDLDLSGYDAQAFGVSRRHARLVAKDNRITIEDLSSANGTYINGQILQTEKPYRLYDGDRISLGKLTLQVHFVIKPSIRDETTVGLENALKVPKVANGHVLLVVDDHEDVLNLIRVIGRTMGFNVLTANSISQAYTLIEETPPTCAVIELLLSDGNGADVVQYLRQRADASKLAIMTMTESTGGFKLGQALEQGTDLFLGKPLAMDEFVAGLTKMAQMVISS